MSRLSNADIDARISRVRDYLRRGFPVKHMAEKEGISRSAMQHFITRHGQRPHKKGYKPTGVNGANWGKERADPSTLTPEQIVHAFRVGITPERYAWLLTCPKTGNAHGWKGGNSIG